MQISLWDQMVSFFLSAFGFSGLNWYVIAVSTILALVFGAVWLLAYRPSWESKAAKLGVVALSAVLTWTAISFVQIPLQVWSAEALLHFWDETTFARWVLVAGIPAVLVSGFVQEAAKLVPILFYRLRRRGSFNAKTGLIIGAIAGAGFGVFEAVWVQNTAFASGWSWQTLQVQGPTALLPFIDRFFAVGFHVAVSGLVGYGVATGRGWHFYVRAAILHGAANYSIVVAQKGVSTTIIDLCLAGCAIVLAGVVLRLRWRSHADRLEARSYA